jgi:hypothetical protein
VAAPPCDGVRVVWKKVTEISQEILCWSGSRGSILSRIRGPWKLGRVSRQYFGHFCRALFFSTLGYLFYDALGRYLVFCWTVGICSSPSASTLRMGSCFGRNSIFSIFFTALIYSFSRRKQISTLFSFFLIYYKLIT